MDLLFGIDPMHLIIAFAGMIIHMFMRLAEISNSTGFNIIAYTKKNKYSIISTVIGIPFLLILLKDNAWMSEHFPLNNATAALVGWQSQSIIRAVMSIGSNKIKAIVASNKEKNDTPKSDS